MSEPPVPDRPTFYHPVSDAAILAVDWACFGLEWGLGPVSVVVMSVAAFVSTYAVVWRAQERLRGDPPRLAHAKALAGALAAAVPFPITGTIVGATIIALSGLTRLRR